MSKPGLILFRFIGSHDYKQLAHKTYCKGVQGNPVYAMIRSLRIDPDGRTQLSRTGKNFEIAIEYLQNDNKLTNFLVKKKGSAGFLSNDIVNVHSAIAEILACYNLKRAGFKVVPIDENNQNKTPDFEIIDPNGNVAHVEVNCKNYEESDATVSLCSNSKHQLPNGGILDRTISVHSPFGKATKPNENSTVQAIQKIAQVKQGSKQAVNGQPFILYIDLDTGNTRGLAHLFNSTRPLDYSKEGMITSGIIWYSMYGRKKYPVFEGMPCRMLPCSKSFLYKLKNGVFKPKNSIPFEQLICRMEHDGKFLTDHKVSAVVFRCEEHVIICENCFAINKLCCSTRSCLINMPLVNVRNSMLAFLPGVIEFTNIYYRYIVKRLLS